MNQDKLSEIRKILNKTPEKDAAPSASGGPGAPDPAAAPHEDLAIDWQSRCAALQDELARQKEDFVRKLADFENFRKRLVKDKEESLKYANEKLLQDVFPILDSLEMTLSHAGEKNDDPIVSGVRLILKQLLQTLQKHGLEEVGAAGETFDPNFHEAIASAPAPDTEPGLVTQVHRKGYKLKDRLIRAAMVTVSQ